MQRLLTSNFGILSSYVAIVAAVSLVARWQLILH